MPFIGESGGLLKKQLQAAGYNADHPEPYITNAVKCSPGDKKDQTALKHACQACRGNLIAEIAAHPRSVILALGAAAIWSLTGDYSLKITQVRGQVFPSPLASHGIVASVHPAFLLRGGGSINKFKSDIGLAAEAIQNIKRPRYKNSTETILHTVDDFMQVIDRLTYVVWWYKVLGLSPVPIATDIETTGFSALENLILCLAFTWEDEHSYVIPEEAFEDEEYLAAMKDFLEWSSDEVIFIWHNGKFDIQFFWAIDIDARVDEDLMLLSYTLDENKGLHDLEQVSNDAIKAPNWKAMLDEHKPDKNASYDVIPRPILYKYAGKDVAATLQSWRVLHPRVNGDLNSRTAYYELMVDASHLLGRIETVGIKVDQEQVKYNMARLDKEMTELQRDFDAYTMELCGQTFNMQSPPQITRLLFDILSLEAPKGERSTGKDILATMEHKAIDFVLAYRRLAKKKGTYVKVLLPWRREKNRIIRGHVKRDGRVHASYLIHGTVTGRLSSRKPNMQNQPRDPEIRSQFCSEDGHVLIEVDLNQAELRVLAELSRDPGLMEIYLDPDHPGLHHEVSITLFGSGYNKDEKVRAKAVNFGIVYGRTGGSIAEEFNMPKAEGERWVSGWASRFPHAWDYIQKCREAPLKGRTLITNFGRKRRFGIVTRANAHSVQNEASNFPFQSIASDVTLKSTGRVVRDRRYKCVPVNLIHDAGLHEVINDLDIIDYQVALIQYYMAKEAPLWGLSTVPFTTEAELGTHWGKSTKYKVKGQYTFN
jgi:DNA polymerase-1